MSVWAADATVSGLRQFSALTMSVIVVILLVWL